MKHAGPIREKHDGALGDRSSVRVWLRLLSCTMAIEKEVQRRFAERGMTLPRFDVLAALERNPDGITMGALSRALLVSNGNVTSIVRQLEAQGLVASRPDPKDRRSAIVSLTPEGKRQFAEMAAAHEAWVRDSMRDFPPARQQQLFELLDELKKSIGRG